MKLAAVVTSVTLVSITLAGVPPVQAASVDAGDVQTLPRHLQEVGYPNRLLGASADYVMHDVHDTTYDGRSHTTILRASDGSTAWADVEPSPDAARTSLAGGYFVEKVGDATSWPDSVRFFDVETHQLAGEIVRPTAEDLFAVGPGWILTSRYTGEPSSTSYVPVLHRLDGSSVELTNMPINRAPYVTTDGTDAWVRDIYGGPLFHIDVAAGTAEVVPLPEGVHWYNVVVGPSSVFNLEKKPDGYSTVTAIDKADGSLSTYELAPSTPTGTVMPLGSGLAAYSQPGSLEGTVRPIDLASGDLGPPIADHLSDAWSMGGGKIAMVAEEQAPGSIVVADGDGAAPLVDLPRVSEGARALAFDGAVSATWRDDSTWSITPSDADPAWTRTPWTKRQKVTVSGSTTLVNDLDETNHPTSHWHLSWPGGERDVEAAGMKLGHGGELVVRQPPESPSTYEVQRVRTGEVVATFDTPALVADGSRVWSWSSPGILSGVDVDHPEEPARTVDTGLSSAGLEDVRGRWALIAQGGRRVIDTREVVEPFRFPYVASTGAFSPPRLGDGFLVWSTWTYDDYGHVNGIRTTVTDLSPGHESREVTDPDAGKAPTTYVVDEAGSPAVAYLDAKAKPKVLHLPWLHQAPLTLPDTSAPELVSVEHPRRRTRSSTPVAAHFAWTYSDPDSLPSPASGVASYAVRYRVRNAPESFGTWTRETSTTAATLDRTLDPGQEVCAQAKAFDGAGNSTSWSDQRCALVDGEAPVLAKARGSARFTDVDDYDGVVYRYHARDDDRVRSYDVQVRSAAPGSRLGSWQRLLHGTTATMVRHRARRGSEWCFRFRARDYAGNISAWSPARCSSIAIQDDVFYSPGDSTREFSKLALDHWYRELHYPGAWLKLRRRQVGRTLALWVLAGPGQGEADVYVGRTRVGHLSLAAARRHRRLVRFRMPHGGRIRVVQRGMPYVGVDALAVER